MKRGIHLAEYRRRYSYNCQTTSELCQKSNLQFLAAYLGYLHKQLLEGNKPIYITWSGKCMLILKPGNTTQQTIEKNQQFAQLVSGLGYNSRRNTFSWWKQHLQYGGDSWFARGSSRLNIAINILLLDVKADYSANEDE